MRIKNFLIVLIVFILTFSIFSMLNNFSYALDDIVSGMEGVSDASGTSGSNIVKVLNYVIYLVQVAGTGISIIMVTMLGIKYMISSPEDKAEIKKHATPILIGAILLFGAVNILGVVYKFTTESVF